MDNYRQYKKYLRKYNKMGGSTNKKRARLIIFEKEDNGKINIILVHNKKWNSYVTIGGRVGREESFRQTINRETEEETLNTLNINDMDMNYIKYKDGKDLVYIYYIVIGSTFIDESNFFDTFNKNKISIKEQDNAHYDWTEMDDMSKFPLDDLDSLSNFYPKVHDYLGAIINVIDINSIKPVNSFKKGRNIIEPFLKDTVTIFIKN